MCLFLRMSVHACVRPPVSVFVFLALRLSLSVCASTRTNIFKLKSVHECARTLMHLLSAFAPVSFR